MTIALNCSRPEFPLEFFEFFVREKVAKGSFQLLKFADRDPIRQIRAYFRVCGQMLVKRNHYSRIRIIGILVIP